MPFEIEHKYLVKKESWEQVVPNKSVTISQGYILNEDSKTIRVRILDGKGFITIKGKTVNAKRQEFEYEIPLPEAKELINSFCSDVIEKTRHYVYFENKCWEVDVFSGLNSGLIVAEIELNNEKEIYSLPEWVGVNVTEDFRYSNANLVVKPFSKW